MFSHHKKTTRIVKHPIKKDIYVTFTLVSLADHININEDDTNQRVLRKIQSWADLKNPQFGANGQVGWEAPWIRDTRKIEKHRN